MEDDRSPWLQIGSVGVRGQLMNIHSKQASMEQWGHERCSLSTWNVQVAAFFLIFKTAKRVHNAYSSIFSSALFSAIQQSKGVKKVQIH